VGSGLGNNAFARGLQGFRFRASAPKLGAGLAPRPLLLGSADSGVVERPQGGITLGLERCDLDADFCPLGEAPPGTG
jgi:hypothetical protein